MPDFFGFLKNIKSFIVRHKVISGVIVIVLAGVIYWTYSALNGNKSTTSYVLAVVGKQTINTSVTGTGQVSALNQIILSPGSGASGQILYLNAVSGQKVSAGTLLLQLDTTNAQKTIRNAQVSLESTQIALQKLQGSGLLTVPQNKQNAENALAQDYQTGYNAISNTFINLPAVMTGLNNILYGTAFNIFQQNIDYYTSNAYTYDQNATTYRDSANKAYQTALADYNKNFIDYKNISRTSDNTTIESMISETYSTVLDVSQATKNASNLIQFYKDTLVKENIKTNSQADADISNLNNYLGEINTDVNNLLNIQSSLQSDKQAVANSDLDLQSQQLSLQQQQNALQDAKDNLANYYIYAPFDGIVGSVSVQKGDNISSGTSAITFITQSKIANITLSEVDIAKIAVGQKAMLTFDAIDGLTIAGQVTEIDTIGAVSSGVVSYGVQIGFNTQDSRVKPGMSVSVSIITETKQDVLAVPNSAVKSSVTGSYVLVLNKKYDLTNAANQTGVVSATAPTKKTIQVGISNNTYTEIISGLNEGDQVVSRTISNTSVTTAASSAGVNSATKSATRIVTGGGAGFRPGN